jgi:hypothetical protein|tara:strand:- start:210 stop:446 length:237 start_codon:yes stop_codon:yes gene_type:complete
MKIQDVINELKESKSDGFQIERRKGILTSTWLLYKRKDYYYYFDINQKIEFIDSYKYTEEELVNRLDNAYYEIELSIS